MPDPLIRPLREADLEEADRVMRVAFGTFLGLPDPQAFLGDAGYVRGRWRAAPEAAFVAEQGGEVVGSNFATRWGSFAFFGPLSVRPDLWDQGIARRLLDPIMGLFSEWGVRQAGLFTFPQSPKHLGLYQRYGFWPRALTPILFRALDRPPAPSAWTPLSKLSGDERAGALRACSDLTAGVFEGLDVSPELRAIDAQKLGDSVLLHGDSGLSAFAACHLGPGTEAGGGNCYVKFAAVRPGPRAPAHFDRLLDACEDLAIARGLSVLTAGVNTARAEAYQRLLARGYRIGFTGVALHRPAEPAFSRPGVYVLDDWR
ncbi:MAG: GNAT family N-acetyltransferase [Myxococcota bacterium]